MDAPALRFRNGVVGKAGFLKSGAPSSVLVAFLLLLAFLTESVPAAVSAGRFFTLVAVLVIGAAMLALGTLVERRTDMVKVLVIIHDEVI